LLDKHREAVLKVKVPICLNLAAVRLKNKKFDLVVELCNEVLKEAPDNPKALYRKAQALFGLKNFESALESVEKALKVNDDPAVKVLKNQILKALRAENEKFKKMWKGKLIPKAKGFSFARFLHFFNPFNLHFRIFPLIC
jgi:tetratricopeptide (TPR) repeat protein